MDQKPVFLTRFALARILKSFATRLGLEDTMADIAAQVHTSTTPAIENWSNFLSNNCAECIHDPSTCPWLNPDNSQKLFATPAEAKVAMALTVEHGHVTLCPMIERD